MEERGRGRGERESRRRVGERRKGERKEKGERDGRKSSGMCTLILCQNRLPGCVPWGQD